ncbi:mRNA-degrading endonuclease YafQ of YafQ-DinJ toxin-antitoxin module [Desulfomicrobium macestii]|uniref:mRNA-degrading endonuclease (mRNA interferase) YafQ, toxin component of the YafQ-DinJ toxin-antitoxin module n=2 Tax=Desulfomicrobium TaxID=898 RepID=A0A8G2C066_DESNO|nr:MULTISPECIES: plasmid stabilization protein [Desulfomicrobium]MBE1424083.1 mRNA-degrading endonuclease YafQ of YafQ-DinJ toxin-antitoxin module [Desulfomicrobium macestii]SFL31291.1 mRNA-degrading endonuclease (mRNA interferase) YafQ, toxin component of the YafQ-DinJ toxin-antitoxin module [Desulfomicrobium norvegicum]
MNKFAIIFTESYSRRARKFFKAHPELLGQYEKCLFLMEANPFHPSLRIHPLQGRLAGLHSISITMSYRLTIEFLIEDKEIIPVNIGTHDQVYG